MMRSLFSGVSGLRVHQSRMDVIGNNIANVNTVGFKASRMTFADAMSQRMAGASADNPDTGRAGRNPQQIGLGVNIGGIDNLMTQGAAQRTDRPLDLTIQGEGFFIVSDATGVYFTRAGNVDWNGRSFSIGGMRLMGWPSVWDDRAGEFVIQQGSVQPLETPPEVHSMDPRATSMMEVIGNLNPNEARFCEERGDGTMVVRRPVEFYDTIGNRYTANVIFRWFPPATHSNFLPLPAGLGLPHSAIAAAASTNVQSNWTFEFELQDGAPAGTTATIFPNGDTRNPVHIPLAFDSDPDPATQPTTAMGIINFDPFGRVAHVSAMAAANNPAIPSITTVLSADRRSSLYMFLNTTAASVLLPPAFPGAPDPGLDGDDLSSIDGNFSRISLNLSAITQHEGMRNTARFDFLNGNAAGALMDIMVGPDGLITGRYSNGVTRPLGQIPLAQFRNPAGLERAGNNLWLPTTNSGWFDGVGSHGDMMPGTLEMSNVDLSSEFTEMIITQRGFQANSRVISTSDEFLVELVNLRR